jgi:hypothetical protein
VPHRKRRGNLDLSEFFFEPENGFCNRLPGYSAAVRYLTLAGLPDDRMKTTWFFCGWTGLVIIGWGAQCAHD